jgi:catechol 2,3-dioxygenase-like lactoylglutathione lyase family enzyme
VGLNVTDLDRSQAFYTALFGFEVIARTDAEGRRFAFLGNEGELVVTLWEQGKEAFSRQSAGLHHLSFEVPSLEEVRRFEERVRGMGAPLLHEGIVAHAEGAPSGGLFFEDPDGIRLEVFSASGAESLPGPAADAPSCGFF